jgi:hypothetical protein
MLALSLFVILQVGACYLLALWLLYKFIKLDKWWSTLIVMILFIAFVIFMAIYIWIIISMEDPIIGVTPGFEHLSYLREIELRQVLGQEKGSDGPYR